MRGVLLVMMLMLVSGCTGAGPPPSAPPEATGLSLPPRPRDLRIDGVEPCSLLTERQRAELGLDGEPTARNGPSVLFGGDEPACVISGFKPRAISVGIGLVTSMGIEQFTARALQADLSQLKVQGYRAVLAVPNRFRDYCSVFVDVSPGKMLDIQLADGGRKPPISQDQLCLDAERVANVAMQTLLGRG